jgi:hypothetical protein
MSYSNILDHKSMVFDEVRNGAYLNAIRKTIKPGDTVLDLGAGLGVLGLLALQEGAARVYMVDPSPVLKVAGLAARHGDFADRVVLIEQAIEETNLPEQVDCIVSVFTGNFMLSEDLLPSLIFARNKYLKPGGVLLPDRGVMEVAPVMAPEFYNKTIEGWSDTAFGIDYSFVRSFAANNTFDVNPAQLDAKFLAAPVPVFDMDFNVVDDASCKTSEQIKVTESGVCHGILGWFRARIGDEWLSTSPHDAKMHWSQTFLPLQQPVILEQGDTLLFELNRPEFGDWTWSVTVNGHKQRQSTFLSYPQDPARLIRLSNDYSPALNEKGKVVLEILNLFNGRHTTGEIAERIERTFPDFCRSERFTLDTIKNLIRHYTETETR